MVYNHLVRILYLIFGCEALLKLEPSHSLNLDKLWNNRHNDYDDGDDDYDESERGITSIWCARVDCILYSHAIILCMFACKLKYNSNELSNHKRFTLQNWFENHHNQNGCLCFTIYASRHLIFNDCSGSSSSSKNKTKLSQHTYFCHNLRVRRLQSDCCWAVLIIEFVIEIVILIMSGRRSICGHDLNRWWLLAANRIV